MLYQRSLNIETRLQAVLRLISEGGYSTPKIAQAIGVSIPTISRDVTALRERGYDIRSERHASGWCYILEAPPAKLLRKLSGNEGRTHVLAYTARRRLPRDLERAVRS